MAKQLKIKDKNGNILYPVAFETGWHPTNNSRYMKFANGVMIVYGQINITPPSWSTWGSLYSYTYSTKIEFPIEFTYTPIVVATNIKNYTAMVAQIVGEYTGITQITLVRGTTTTSGVTIGWVAIGRWN